MVEEKVIGEKVMGERVIDGREGEKKGEEGETDSRRFRNCNRTTATSELQDRHRTDCIPSRGND